MRQSPSMEAIQHAELLRDCPPSSPLTIVPFKGHQELLVVLYRHHHHRHQGQLPPPPSPPPTIINDLKFALIKGHWKGGEKEESAGGRRRQGERGRSV